jgi:hypothetical protein
MDRRDISRILLGTAAGGALLSKPAQAQSCVAPCYARTAVEIAVGVTPVDYSYPRGDVRRYGAVGNGTTSDRAAFQAAIDVMKKEGGVVLVPAPSVSYYIDGPLNCTFASSANQPGFTIRGEGPISVDGPRAIVFNSGGHCFDCAGARVRELRKPRHWRGRNDLLLPGKEFQRRFRLRPIFECRGNRFLPLRGPL